MKLEGKIVQLIAIITIAVTLYITGPWIINTLGRIFEIYEGRDINVQQL